MNKKELRKYAINIRKKLSYDKNQLEKDVLAIIGDKKNIAIYYPLEFEIDLLFLKKYNLNLCFPKTNGLEMEFFLNPTQFIKGNFNVYEPINGTKISYKDIDIMFVPSLIINERNYRIGYGKGYYDRYLYNKNIKTIGICYKELYLDFLEEENDVRLGGVILCRQ
jgi:5-formyltetrahydrofolate cyclo-ligase